MKITCPMCDGNSVLSSGTEIVLDCDWCDGRGWIDESEHRFAVDEAIESESEHREVHQQLVLVKRWCFLTHKTASF